MNKLHRALYILTIALFFLTLALTIIPNKLFLVKKPDLKVILLDVSLSNKGYVLNDKIKPSLFEMKIPKETKVIRGLFSDNLLYLDEKPIDAETFKKQNIDVFLNEKSPLMEQLNLEATNYEKVIRNVVRDFSNKYSCDIVLITDGKQSQGDLLKVKQELEKTGTRVQLAPTNYEVLDLSIIGCDLPEIINPGEKVMGSIQIKSNFEQKNVVFKIIVDDEIVSNLKLNINRGVMNYLFSFSMKQNNYHRVQIVAEIKDTLLRNNSIVKYIKESSSGRVLLVSKRDFVLPLAIKSKFTKVSPLNIHVEIENLSQYESIWLEDISWIDLLEKDKIDKIEKFVMQGGKLFVSGGSHSFAFGDYHGSALEKLLPVYINPNGLLSLLVGIDSSGSMEQQIHGKRKIDISVSALLELIQGLQERDEVGLFFSQNSKKPELFIPLEPKSKFETNLREKFNQIPLPSGGTFLKPGLQTAIESLQNSKKELKVAIIITDGESQETGYKELFLKFKEENPEIIVLVIGAGLKLDSLIVIEGKQIFGQEWEPIRVEEKGWFNLKDSFKEAFKKIASGYSTKGLFFTNRGDINASFRFIKTVEDQFNGIYLKTSLKKSASSLILIDEQYPLMSIWNYGQGQVLSFQSGLYSDWSQKYFERTQGQEVLNSIFNWMSGDSSMSQMFAYHYEDKLFNMQYTSDDIELQKESILNLLIQEKELVLNRVSENKWSCKLLYNDIPFEWFQLPSLQYKVIKKSFDSRLELDSGVMPALLPSEYLSTSDSKLFLSMIPSQEPYMKLFENWENDEVVNGLTDKSFTNILAFMAMLFFLSMIFVRGRFF